LENLNDSQYINRAGENVKEIIRTSAKDSISLYELRQLKPKHLQKPNAMKI